MKNLSIASLFALGMLLPALANALETRELVIKDHKFTPTEITIPANTRIKLMVDNQDATPEEFESNDFHREKIIPGNSKAAIFVPPLEPGEYKFFGEFNLDTAQGILKVE